VPSHHSVQFISLTDQAFIVKVETNLKRLSKNIINFIHRRICGWLNKNKTSSAIVFVLWSVFLCIDLCTNVASAVCHHWR